MEPRLEEVEPISPGHHRYRVLVGDREIGWVDSYTTTTGRKAGRIRVSISRVKRWAVQPRTGRTVHDFYTRKSAVRFLVEMSEGR